MADNDTTTQVEEQTPAQEKEMTQTPAPKEETKEETLSKAEVTRMLKKQAAELTARYKPFEEKAKKFEEAELAKKTDEEKAAKRLKDLEDKIAEKDKSLKDRELKDLIREKIEKAIADGLMELPKGKTVSSLVARSKAIDEAEVDSDIEDLIGFFPVSVKVETKEAQKGLGTQTKTGDQPGKISNKDRLAEVNGKLRDTSIKLSARDKDALVVESIRLSRLIQKGEL
jgi:hypothetical protein